MKQFISFLLFLFCFSISESQIVQSNCTASDSIIKKYRNDADRLCIRRLTLINSPYKDSAEIYRPLSYNYLSSLLAVYNATTLAARDTIVAMLPIHTASMIPYLNSIQIQGDSNLVWMQNLHHNISPTGNAGVDNLISKYLLQKTAYFTSASTNVVTAYHRTDSNWNIKALAYKFSAIPTVSATGWGGNNWSGGGDIKDTIYSNYTVLIYSYSWGDCPSGCTGKRSWKFKVYNDCSVEYIGSYGSPIDPALLNVGIQSNSDNLKTFEIYPSPATNRLYFEVTNSSLIITSLNIYNSLGENVFQVKAPDISRGLDIGFLKPGIFYLKVESGKKPEIIKFIKY